MLVAQLKIKTVSEANKTGEHWTKKHKRHKAQRNEVILILRPAILALKQPILPCKITMTRVAPRKLDIGDNLPMSLKTVRDQLAELITGESGAGRGDGDERIQFEYKQIKGDPKEYAVIIEITSTS